MLLEELETLEEELEEIDDELELLEELETLEEELLLELVVELEELDTLLELLLEGGVGVVPPPPPPQPDMNRVPTSASRAVCFSFIRCFFGVSEARVVVRMKALSDQKKVLSVRARLRGAMHRFARSVGLEDHCAAISSIRGRRRTGSAALK